VSSKNPIHSWVAAASERTSTVLMLASCMALAQTHTDTQDQLIW
jgi:hypothetical protein